MRVSLENLQGAGSGLSHDSNSDQKTTLRNIFKLLEHIYKPTEQADPAEFTRGISSPAILHCQQGISSEKVKLVKLLESIEALHSCVLQRECAIMGRLCFESELGPQLEAFRKTSWAVEQAKFEVYRQLANLNSSNPEPLPDRSSPNFVPQTSVAGS